MRALQEHRVHHSRHEGEFGFSGPLGRGFLKGARPASIGLAVFMLGAIEMPVKVHAESTE